MGGSLGLSGQSLLAAAAAAAAQDRADQDTLSNLQLRTTVLKEDELLTSLEHGSSRSCRECTSCSRNLNC